MPCFYFRVLCKNTESLAATALHATTHRNQPTITDHTQTQPAAINNQPNNHSQLSPTASTNLPQPQPHCAPFVYIYVSGLFTQLPK